MKTLFPFVLILLLAAVSFAYAKAYWTGKSKPVVTATGKSGISCEYSLGSDKFWKTFIGNNCPGTIEVY